MQKNMFNPSLLQALLEREDLQGRYIQKIYDEVPHTFWVKTSGKILYISCERAFPFLGFLDDKSELSHPPQPSPFCETLRHHLSRGKFLQPEQPEGERIVTWQIEKYRDQVRVLYSLVIELIPQRANLILVSQEGIILAILHPRQEKNRQLQQGELYLPPPPRFSTLPRELPPHQDWWRALRDHQKNLWAVSARQKKLVGLTREEKKCKKGLQKVEGELERAATAGVLQQQGELLKANYHLLKRGMTEVVVTDYYQDPPQTVTLGLDPVFSPEKNIEKFFKRAKKLRDGRHKMEERRGVLKARLAKIQEEISFWKEGDDGEILDAWKKSQPKIVFKKKAVSEPLPFRRFLSRDGWTLLVGRNDRENEKLSLHTARGRDFFFHVQGFPGSHVVAINPSREAHIPRETLLDGATLAVYYSKIRGDQKAEVIYTQCKNLKKPKKAPPGKVSVLSQKTVLIVREEERLGRLLESAQKEKQTS